MESKNAPAVRRVLRKAGSASLLLAPLAAALGWALNYLSIRDFFTFDFSSPYVSSGKSSSAEQFVSTITGPDGGFRSLLLPHFFEYAAMPLFIAAALYLASVLFRSSPWHAVIGSALTIVGAVYFVGVLGAWLSFPALADVPAALRPDILPMVRALTKVQGVLLVSTTLSVLVFLGLIVLACGLLRTRTIPRWSAGLIIAGSVLILVFAGTENWMVIGSLSMFAGLLPMSMKDLRRSAVSTAVLE